MIQLSAGSAVWLLMKLESLTDGSPPSEIQNRCAATIQKNTRPSVAHCFLSLVYKEGQLWKSLSFLITSIFPLQGINKRGVINCVKAVPVLKQGFEDGGSH